MSTLLVLESREATSRHRNWFPDPSTLDRLLALGESERRAQTIPEGKTDAKRESARARIMVVDDMADVREFLRDFLEEEGYAVNVQRRAASELCGADEPSVTRSVKASTPFDGTPSAPPRPTAP